MARAGERLDRALGRDPREAVDDRSRRHAGGGLRAAQAGRGSNRHGQLAYSPHVAFWAQRGRALTCELVPATARSSPARDVRADRAARDRAVARRARARSRSASTRPSTRRAAAAPARAPGAALHRLGAAQPGDVVGAGADRRGAWTDALDMPGARGRRDDLHARRLAARAAAADRPPRRRSAPTRSPTHPRAAAQARSIPTSSHARARRASSRRCYGYSFILTDLDGSRPSGSSTSTATAPRSRSALKDAKLGQALRHLPSGDLNANRVWLSCALLALNLTAMVCDLCPAAGASGKAPDGAPLRRAAKTLRRICSSTSPPA